MFVFVRRHAIFDEKIREICKIRIVLGGFVCLVPKF